MLHLQSFIQHT